MKTTIVILGIAAAALITGFVSTHAYACQGQRSHCEGHGPSDSKAGHGYHSGLGQVDRMMRHLGKLDLTPQQSDQIHELFKSNATQFVDVAWNMSQAKRELKAAVHGAETDEKAVRATAQRVGKAITEAAVLKFKIRKEVMAVLTPEQQEQCKQMYSHRYNEGACRKKEPGKYCSKTNDPQSDDTQGEQN